MSDEDGTLFAQLVEQPHQVAGEMLDVIVLDRSGTARAPVAALIRRDHPAARGRERGDLMTPRVRKLGKTVCQNHGCAGTRFDDVQVDTIRTDRSFVDVGHPGGP